MLQRVVAFKAAMDVFRNTKIILNGFVAIVRRSITIHLYYSVIHDRELRLWPCTKLFLPIGVERRVLGVMDDNQATFRHFQLVTDAVGWSSEDHPLVYWMKSGSSDPWFHMESSLSPPHWLIQLEFSSCKDHHNDRLIESSSNHCEGTDPHGPTGCLQ